MVVDVSVRGWDDCTDGQEALVHSGSVPSGLDEQAQDSSMRRWKRPWQDLRLVLGYPLLAVIVLMLVCAVVAQGWSAAVFSVPIVFGVVLLWRLIRSGIDVSEAGIRIRRFIRTDVVPWEHIAAVDVSAAPRPQIVLRLVSGPDVLTYVYRDYPGGKFEVWLHPGSFDRLVGRLHELHSRALGNPELPTM